MKLFLVFLKSILTVLLLIAQTTGNTLAAELLSADEFDGNTLNSDLWEFHDIGKRFDGVNSKDSVKLENGNLTIISNNNGKEIFSGAIKTKSAVPYDAKYLEIRVKFPPSRQGLQCVVWLNSNTAENRTEPNLKKPPVNSIITIARYASTWGGIITSDLQWKRDSENKIIRHQSINNLDDGEFHTLGMLISDRKYKFSLDGKPYWTAEEGISTTPLTLNFSCDIKNALGKLKESEESSKFLIDYVRIYDDYHIEQNAESGTPIEFTDLDIRSSAELISTVNPIKENGVFPSRPDDNNAIKVRIPAGKHLGVDAVFNLPFETKEAWFSYCIFIPNSWNPKIGGKLPGFSGMSGRWFGGQGGMPSKGYNAWSARMMYGASDTGVPIGQYVYHSDQVQNSEYGDPDWWSDSDSANFKDAVVIQKGQWSSITQHLKMNSRNSNNGIIEGWLDGKLAYRRTDFNFSNSWIHRRIDKIWLNVYYGGKEASTNEQTIYFDQLVYSTNPNENTVANCPYQPEYHD